MKLRDGFLIIGGLALVGAIVAMLMALGGGSVGAVANLPPAATDTQGPQGLEGGALGRAPGPATTITAQAPERQPDTSGMTSGIIRGDIVLDSLVSDRIRSITVSIQELGGERPYSRSRKVVMERGTPGFEFTGVPFSQHAYAVSVFSPGLNGSEQSVAVTAQDPEADAILGISPPAPFSIVLVDQFGVGVSDLEVSMLPIELPLGRGPKHGKVDNRGSVLFEEVLAGDYLVYVGNATNPLVKPVRVTVRPPGVTIQPETLYLRGKPLLNQFAKITVPQGKALIISVTGSAGRGLKDAKLTLLATTSTRYQPYEGMTDYTGQYVFPHLPAGEYELNVELENHQRRTLTVRWKEGEDPPQQDVVLYPLRK